MKQCLAIITVLLFPIVISAQTDKPNDNTIKPPSLIGGLQADVHVATTYAYRSGNSFILIAGGGIVFARKYFGQHFALELDINRGISEKTYSDVYSPLLYFPTHSFSYQIKSLDIPLHFQYHMGKREKRLRPYVGLGIGYALISTYTGYKDNSTGIWSDYFDVETNSRPMIQLTEGITFNIGKRLQINQSLYYKMVHDIGNHRMGIRFGLGYIIM